MEVVAIKTEKILPGADLIEILDRYIPMDLAEGTVIAITSKIVSLCEGAYVGKSTITKQDLIRAEAEFYLPPEHHAHEMTISIKGGRLIPAAGIDESNAKDLFVCYPRHPYHSIEKVRQWLKIARNIRKIGIIMTDSTVMPLRLGVIGICVAWCGFRAIRDYRGTKDCFGNILKYTSTNIIDSLANMAVFAMGEGNEQTPIAIIRNCGNNVEFQDRAVTEADKAEIMIEPENDVYEPLFRNTPFIKGESTEG